MLRNYLVTALAGILGCGLWLAAGVVAAEPTPSSSTTVQGAPSDSTEVSGIVVQAHKSKTDKAFEAAVGKLVHDLGRPGPIGQIARWREPICPRVMGLTQSFDDFVSQRIGDDASEVGAPHSQTCHDFNVLVVFTTEPQKLMADVRDHHPALLGYHFSGETKALATFQGPMESWYVTATSIKTGIKDYRTARQVDVAYAPGPPTGTGSHIPPELVSEFALELVVIDANPLDGQEIGPVADKIAMLVLSKPAERETRGECSPLPSVMDVLDPKCPSAKSIDGLTSYDKAFLKGLYSYQGNELRAFERAKIAERIVQETGDAPQTPAGQ